MRALIADPDLGRARRIGRICASRGLDVDHVSHGAEALQRALDTPPDLVVCPLDLSVIDGARLSQILRANPKTATATFLFLLEDELDAPLAMKPSDRLVLAPWREPDLLQQLEATLGGEEAPGAPSGGEVEGDLGQLSLLDLLQLFSETRKTGILRVLPKDAPRGTVLVREGEVIDASVSTVEGATIEGSKAFFRLAACVEGRFEFSPEALGSRRTMAQPIRSLLLEAARQLDEGERFRRELPDPGLRVCLSEAADKLPPAAHPLTRDVLAAAAGGASVREIVDEVSAPDYQVLRTLHALFRRGLLERDTADFTPTTLRAAESREGVFAAVQVDSIRAWAAAQRPPIFSGIRVPVVASDAGALRTLLEAICELPGACGTKALESSDLDTRFALLAEIPLEEGLALQFVGLPIDPRFEALWSVAASGMLGALVVVDRPAPDVSRQVDRVCSLLEATGRPVLSVLAGSLAESAQAPETEEGLPPDRADLVPGPWNTPGAEQRTVVRNLLSRLAR